jgi:hypothetical protein
MAWAGSGQQKAQAKPYGHGEFNAGGDRRSLDVIQITWAAAGHPARGWPAAGHGPELRQGLGPLRFSGKIK